MSKHTKEPKVDQEDDPSASAVIKALRRVQQAAAENAERTQVAVAAAQVASDSGALKRLPSGALKRPKGS